LGEAEEHERHRRVGNLKVKVLYFAAAQGMAKVRSEDVPLDEGSSMGDLVRKLLSLHPALKSIEPTVRYSVNYVIEGESVSLHDGDEIAVLPPVAGG
jgi:molybdopterin converting factor small subunit